MDTVSNQSIEYDSDDQDRNIGYNRSRKLTGETPLAVRQFFQHTG